MQWKTTGAAIAQAGLPVGERMPAWLAAMEMAGLLGLAFGFAVAGTLGWASPAAAGTVLEWQDLEPGELRVTYMEIQRPVALRIAALGTVGREDLELLAYPWILDAESRKAAWILDGRKAEPRGRSRSKQGTQAVEIEESVNFQPGHYEIYFTTFGDAHRVDFSSWFGRLEKKREIRFGHLERDDWQLKVTCADQDAAAVVIGDQAKPRFSPLLRFADPPQNASWRRPFKLDKAVPLVVYAIGEYSSTDDAFADRGWIERADDQEVVWEMVPANTVLAGGAQKNRSFRETIDLSPGTYVLCYSSDSSHGPGDWNLNPPLDPAFWGIALFDGGGARAHFTADVKDPQETNLTVDLGRQTSSSFNLRGIRVRRPVTLRVQAVGELDLGSDRFADYGWIEQARTHRQVWAMSLDNTEAAGGAAKNREVRAQVQLQPDDYLVCFWTDDSHAYGDWNAAPPRNPEAWGIRVWGAGERFDPKSIETYEEDKDPLIMAQLLGIGNERHATERFTVKSKSRARILALGEGTHGQMFDFGWLERVDGERTETVWRMRFASTEPAGGADKNRRQEEEIELTPGTYVLHYVTDDSHSFEEWNAYPPDQPHLWGVAVIRLK
jgi:hypothetical protein